MKLSDLVTSARKFTVAAAALAGDAIAAGLLHGTAERWATVLIAVAGAITTYAVPNTPNEPRHE